jgi:hypothetical protein
MQSPASLAYIYLTMWLVGGGWCGGADKPEAASIFTRRLEVVLCLC